MKPGSSSPGLRNAFDLPPEELNFSLTAKKAVHGTFLFVNISLKELLILLTYLTNSWEKIAQFLLRITVLGD